MLKIRLSRHGAKKRPFFHIVIAEHTRCRDGQFVEKVGTYNPMLQKTDTQRINLNTDRIKYWLGVGAQPTDRVAKFLGDANLIAKRQYRETPTKSLPKAKAQERLKAAADAAAAPAEAAPAPAAPAPAEAPAA
ncbi:MAG: 30S ribosomal protein S16 [Alphaproteobacteria bacterium]|nr:MAG: 30S ribosomal protein S16 [Alphaproteobacteria bacterium]